MNNARTAIHLTSLKTLDIPVKLTGQYDPYTLGRGGRGHLKLNEASAQHASRLPLACRPTTRAMPKAMGHEPRLDNLAVRRENPLPRLACFSAAIVAVSLGDPAPSPSFRSVGAAITGA